MLTESTQEWLSHQCRRRRPFICSVLLPQSIVLTGLVNAALYRWNKERERLGILLK